MRTSLWDYLKDPGALIVGPLIIIGDFNEICSKIEVGGANFATNHVTIFIYKMNTCNVMNLDSGGAIPPERDIAVCGTHSPTRHHAETVQ